MPESQKDTIAGYLAEYAFITQGIRINQRERHGFLAFSLAASGLILGILMRSRPPLVATEVCFLVGLAAGMTLIAERMTIRASHAVALAAAYLRYFIEPHVEGLSFQGRFTSPLRQGWGVASASHSFAMAYAGLTAAFVLAWLAAPVEDGRQWWQTVLIGILSMVSIFQIQRLSSFRRSHYVPSNAWREVYEDEHHVAGLRPPQPGTIPSGKPSS
jgi:hypothetical protein